MWRHKGRQVFVSQKTGYPQAQGLPTPRSLVSTLKPVRMNEEMGELMNFNRASHYDLEVAM